MSGKKPARGERKPSASRFTNIKPIPFPTNTSAGRSEPSARNKETNGRPPRPAPPCTEVVPQASSPIRAGKLAYSSSRPQIKPPRVPTPLRTQSSLHPTLEARIALRNQLRRQKVLDGSRHPTSWGMNRGKNCWEVRNFGPKHGRPGAFTGVLAGTGHRVIEGPQRQGSIQPWHLNRQQWEEKLTGGGTVRQESSDPTDEQSDRQSPRVVLPRTLHVRAILGGRAKSEDGQASCGRDALPSHHDPRRRRAIPERGLEKISSAVDDLDAGELSDDTGSFMSMTETDDESTFDSVASVIIGGDGPTEDADPSIQVEIMSASQQSPEGNLDVFSETDCTTEVDKLDLFSTSSIAEYLEQGLTFGEGTSSDLPVSAPLVDFARSADGSKVMAEIVDPSARDELPPADILDEDWGATPTRPVAFPARQYIVDAGSPVRFDSWGNKIRDQRREPLRSDWTTGNVGNVFAMQGTATFPNNIPLGSKQSVNGRGPAQVSRPAVRTAGDPRRRTVSSPAYLMEHTRSQHAGRARGFAQPSLSPSSRQPFGQSTSRHRLTSLEQNGPSYLCQRYATRSRGDLAVEWELKHRSDRRAEQLRRQETRDRGPVREMPYRFATDTFSMGVTGTGGAFETGFCFPVTESSIAWDPTKRAFLLDILPATPEDVELPLALEMVDAKIDLEDIATRGIRLSWAPVDGTPMSREGMPYAGPVRDVTLELTLRRSPQFFVPLTDEDGRFIHRMIRVEAPPPGSELLTNKDKWHEKRARELDLANLSTVEPYKVLQGTRELPSKPSTRPPVGYDAIQPDGLVGHIRRKPIDTGVIRWRRATEFDFSMSRQGSEEKSGSLSVDNDVRYAVQSWRTYRFTFYMNERGFSSLERLLLRLRLIEEEEDEQYLADLVKEEPTVMIDPDRSQRGLQEPTIDRVRLDTVAALGKLPFSTRYLVEGLVSQAIIQSHQVEDLVAALTSTIGDHCDLVDDVLTSLYILQSVPDVTRRIKQRFSAFQQIKEMDKGRGRKEDSRSQNMVMRKAIVTPTRMLLTPPEQEGSNSILRMYAKYSDRFLRVQFNDEHDRLTINAHVLEADRLSPSSGTIARVRRALKHGLIVAGRKYRFLAASSSQSKETSAWFFANVSKKENGGGAPFGIEDIMRSIGQIRERIVAKYASRQGLSFSVSVPLDITVKRRNKLLDDITGVLKGETYTFTDGVGKCSQSVCDSAARALGMISDVDLHPSAVQFRLGGSKGLLVAWPDVKEREVWLRPSQVKFESDLKELHAVRVSQYRNAFLNRQFCILFCDLGVPREIFTTMFMQQAERFLDLPARVKAGTISAADLALVDRISAFPVRSLIKAGHQADPIVQDVLSVIERRLLAELRWHARIEISKGVYLYGVCDESGSLAEGEVFCQYSDPDSLAKGATVVLGKCTICRAPALHPGDIRLVNAVDKPALHHLVNVIVFSTKGQRDLPNKLGGGDLDGDEMTLIWDKRIVDQVKERAPADYQAPKSQRIAWVEPEDIKENYVDHLLNDILGICGNAHLAWADMEGPSSQKCIDICGMYSTAVDFAKTGVPAVLPGIYRPSRWPDFMGKPPHVTYPGKSVLGDLFRQATTLEKRLPPHFHPKTLSDISVRDMDPRIARIEVPSTILELAVILKHRYDVTITFLLLKYKLTEMEVLSGLALRNSKRKRIRDNDLKEPIRNAYKELVSSTRELAEHAIKGMHLPQTGSSHLQLFAAAAYQVTYDRELAARHDGRVSAAGAGTDVSDDDSDEGSEAEELELISFAWVLWKELLSLSGQTD